MTEYRVGIVVPNCGLSDNQVADLGARLKFIRQYIGPEGSLVILAPAINLREPMELPSQITGVLQYRTQCEVRELPALKGSAGLSAGAFLVDQLKSCDEVWCCTAPGQGALSKSRPADVYRRAQALPMREATRFKPVPAWVMQAQAHEAAKKSKRKELKWKDVF